MENINRKNINTDNLYKQNRKTYKVNKENFDMFLEGYGRHCNPEEGNKTPHLNVTAVKIAVGADNQTELTLNSVTTFKNMLK